MSTPEPIRNAATRETARLFRRGTISLAPRCEGCDAPGRLSVAFGGPRGVKGKPSLVVHHRDYGDPSDVAVLCHACHSQVHAGTRPFIGRGRTLRRGTVDVILPTEALNSALYGAVARLFDAGAEVVTSADIREQIRRERGVAPSNVHAIVRAAVADGWLVQAGPKLWHQPIPYAPGPAYHAAPSEAA